MLYKVDTEKMLNLCRVIAHCRNTTIMPPADIIISVTGTSCPIPIIELAKASKEAQPGQIIQITGDDPIFDIGIRDFCEAQGFELVELRQGNDHQYTAFIKC